MPVQFTYPIYLLVLAAAVPYFVVASRRSFADLTRVRRKVALAMRIGLLSALVLALAGTQLVKQNRSIATVFVLDHSDSVSNRQKQRALEFVRKQLKKMNAGDSAGVVVFGSEALVEDFPQEHLAVRSIQSVPGTAYSDISQGIRLAMASLPQGAVKRIVLCTDGNENLGDALREALVAQTNRVEISCYPLASEFAKEVLVDRLSVRNEVKIGEPMEMRLVVTSLTPQNAQVRILENGRPINDEVKQLNKGKNVFTFTHSIDQPGHYELEALVDGEEDTIPENNRGLGFVNVRGKPKVLFVEGGDLAHFEAARALTAQDFDVIKTDPRHIPTKIEEFTQYDSVFFSDVASHHLSDEQMRMVQSAVQDMGMGFGMIGGDQSFGVGGYHKTPIEESLPVSMEVKKELRIPSIAVAMVIDRSGSMSEPAGGKMMKVDLAKNAAAAAVEILKPEDMVGVVAFDWVPRVMVPMTDARNRNTIRKGIGRIGIGGGTNMYPAMAEGYKMLRDQPAEVRHMILLTDGVSAPGDFGGLTKRMAAEKITVSTVAVGGDADVKLLSAIAKLGNGMAYVAQDARRLPRIFLQDVLLASKSYIVEEDFYPVSDPQSEILKGFDVDKIPLLRGYVATTIKPRARVSMLSHKEDPVLATWRYGLGKSLAFTSDAKARWAPHWLQWNDFGRFWAQAVRWTLRSTSKHPYQAYVDIDRGVGKITVEAVDEKGAFVNFLDLDARVLDPEGHGRTYELAQTGPGKYEAEFAVRSIGSYMVTVSRKENGETKSVQTVGGVVVTEKSDVFKRTGKSVRSPLDLWKILLLVGVILFPLDVAARRIMINYDELAASAARYWEGVRDRARERRERLVPQQITVGRLLSRKREVTPKTQGPKEPPTIARPPVPSSATESHAPASEPEAPAAAATPSEPSAAEAPLARRLLDKKRKRN
jgi:Ca-activated chloride channel family protein